MKALHIVYAALSLLNPHHTINPKYAMCLAQNIYWEARNASTRDKILVANTAISTARKRGVSVCAEVYTPGRYQWTGTGWGGNRNLEREIKKNRNELEAFTFATQIAVLKLSGDDLGIAVEPDNFFSPHVLRKHGLQNPAWAKDKIVVASSNDFIFVQDR